MKKTLAMILAGGRVNELGVLTIYRPKSAVPFGGLYRVIDFPLSNLMHSGISKVGILSQYRSSSLITHIGIGADWDLVGRQRGVVMLPPFKGESDSDWYLGTADAVYQNLNYINDNNPDLVMILSGDHIYKMDYQSLIQYHLENEADLTAVFKQVPQEQASRFGIAHFKQEDDRGGELSAYYEKPQNAESNWASLTIYLFNRNVLNEVLQQNHLFGKSHHIGKGVIPQMLGNYRVFGFKFSGYWGYTQTIEEYWKTSMDIIDLPDELALHDWGVRTNQAHRNIRDRVPTKISDGGKIRQSVMYNGCMIEGEVEHSILFPGVRVEKGAVIRDSIVMFDTIIGAGSTIEQSIIGSDVRIDKNVSIGCAEESEIDTLQDGNYEITIVGEGTQIPESTSIGKNCVINPHLKAKHFSNKHFRSGTIIK